MLKHPYWKISVHIHVRTVKDAGDITLNIRAIVAKEFFAHSDSRNNTPKCGTFFTERLYRAYSGGKLQVIFEFLKRNMLLKRKARLLLSVESLTLENFRRFDTCVTQWKSGA